MRWSRACESRCANPCLCRASQLCGRACAISSVRPSRMRRRGRLPKPCANNHGELARLAIQSGA
eukprot:1546216-Pleurochrysis_carterae.AAC.1